MTGIVETEPAVNQASNKVPRQGTHHQLMMPMLPWPCHRYKPPVVASAFRRLVPPANDQQQQQQQPARSLHWGIQVFAKQPPPPRAQASPPTATAAGTPPRSNPTTPPRYNNLNADSLDGADSLDPIPASALATSFAPQGAPDSGNQQPLQQPTTQIPMPPSPPTLPLIPPRPPTLSRSPMFATAVSVATSMHPTGFRVSDPSDTHTLDPFGSLLNALDPGSAATNPKRCLPVAVPAGSGEPVTRIVSPEAKATVLWPEIDISNMLSAGAAVRLRASGHPSQLFTSSSPPMHTSDHSLTSLSAATATAGVRAALAIGSRNQLPSTSIPALPCVSPSALQTAQAGAIKARLSSMRPPAEQQQHHHISSDASRPVPTIVETSRDIHVHHATDFPPDHLQEEGNENRHDTFPNSCQNAPETAVSQGDLLGKKGSGRQRWQLPEPLQPSRHHQPLHNSLSGSAVLQQLHQMPWEARVNGPATTSLSWQMRQADAEAASEEGHLPHFAGLGLWPPVSVEGQWGATGPESPHSDYSSSNSVTAGHLGTAPLHGPAGERAAENGQQPEQLEQYRGPCLTRVIDFRPLISQAALHPVIQDADGGGSQATVQRSLGTLSFPTASQEGQWQGSERPLHHQSTEGSDATLAHGMMQQGRRGSSDRYSNVRRSQGSDDSGRELRTQKGAGVDLLRGSSDSSVNFVMHGHANGEQLEIDEDGAVVQVDGSLSEKDIGSGVGEHSLRSRSDHSTQQLIDHSTAHSAQSSLITGQASDGTHSGGSSNLLMPTPDFDSRSPDPRDRPQQQDCSSEVAGGVGANQAQGPHTKDEDIAVQLMGRAVAEADRAMVGAMRQSAGVLVQSSTAALHELEGMMDRLTLLREQLIASRQQQQ